MKIIIKKIEALIMAATYAEAGAMNLARRFLDSSDRIENR